MSQQLQIYMLQFILSQIIFKSLLKYYSLIWTPNLNSISISSFTYLLVYILSILLWLGLWLTDRQLKMLNAMSKVLHGIV